MAYTMNKDIWRTRGMAKGGMNRKIMEMVVSTDSTEERNEEEKKKLDYHGAMEAALKSMYDDAYDSMVTQSGKKLGEEVPYLDLLILKKDRLEKHIVWLIILKLIIFICMLLPMISWKFILKNLKIL